MNPDDRSVALGPDLIDRIYIAGRGVAAARNADGILLAILDAISGPTAFEPIASIDLVMLATPDDRSDLMVAAAWDSRADQTPVSGAPYTLLAGSGLGHVIHGEALLVDDVYGDPHLDQGERSTLSRSGLTAFIFIPLMVQDRWLGLLTLGSRRVRAFSPDIIRLSQILADQAGLSLAQYTAFDQTANAPVHTVAPTAPSTESIGEMFARLTADAGDCILMIDLDGKVTHCNAAAQALYHYTADEIVGQSAMSLIPALRRAEYEGWTWAIIHEGRAVRGETERVGKDGDVFPVYSTLWPVKDSGGHILAIAECTIDLSRQTGAQKALQKEIDLVEGILESTNDAILMVDASRQIVTCNLQFENFFQLPRYRLVKQTIDELLDDLRTRSDLPAALSNLLLTLAGDEFQNAGGEFEIETRERRALVWYSTPVYAQDGLRLGRLFVFRDATHEREVDRMKTEFVSLVSHELRTPLTSIKGFTELILDGDSGPVDPAVRDCLDIVKFNTERLISLINDILDMTRIEAGRIELRCDHYPVGSVLGASLLTMQPLIDGRRQELTVEISPDLPQVWVDLDRMAQVVTNLLSNASKYTAPAGKLKIVARLLKQADDPSIPAIPSGVQAPAILIAVHDTGMGISASDQLQLFTRFYRTQEATQQQIAGTGLGLVIVKSLVELHGGQIWLKSEPGQGSSFFFTIPLIGTQ